MLVFKSSVLLLLFLAAALVHAELLGDFNVPSDSITIRTQVKVSFSHQTSDGVSGPVLRISANKPASLPDVISVDSAGDIILQAPGQLKLSSSATSALNLSNTIFALLSLPIIVSFSGSKRIAILLVIAAVLSLSKADEEFELEVVLLYPADHQVQECSVVQGSTESCLNGEKIVVNPSGQIGVTLQSPDSNTDENFTEIVKSADTRQVFVSSSSGDDANDCLSEEKPCKSIAAGAGKLREGYPDHLLLKRGDVFENQTINYVLIGRSATEPTVVAFYGNSGPRPRIRALSSVSHQLKKLLAYVHIIGLHFQAYQKIATDPEFKEDGKKANFIILGGHKHVLIEDCHLQEIELVVQNWDSGDPEHITLRRNIFDGSYVPTSSLHRDVRPSNIYADGVRHLTIEENVFDHGGWHPTVTNAGANMFNHAMYLQYSTVESVVIRNNIVARPASHGLQARGGGLIEDNLFTRAAVGMLVGPGANGGATGHARRNVISEGQSMVKGVNPCEGNNLCTPAFWGVEFSLKGNGDWRSEENIVYGQAPEDSYNRKYKSLSRNAYPVSKEDPEFQYKFIQSNNIKWKWASDSEGTDVEYVDPGRTIADYNADVLKGARDFDAFMDAVKGRPLQTWNTSQSAKAINAWIRAGFQPK